MFSALKSCCCFCVKKRVFVSMCMLCLFGNSCNKSGAREPLSFVLFSPRVLIGVVWLFMLCLVGTSCRNGGLGSMSGRYVYVCV